MEEIKFIKKPFKKKGFLYLITLTRFLNEELGIRNEELWKNTIFPPYNQAQN